MPNRTEPAYHPGGSGLSVFQYVVIDGKSQVIVAAERLDPDVHPFGQPQPRQHEDPLRARGIAVNPHLCIVDTKAEQIKRPG